MVVMYFQVKLLDTLVFFVKMQDSIGYLFNMLHIIIIITVLAVSMLKKNT